MAHPVSDLMSSTMEKIREMMDANTIVGNPIAVGDITVVPVSRISIGYASGGSDFAQKNQKADRDNAFGGGAGMGVNITPVSFLVIQNGNVRVISAEQPGESTMDKVIDLVPGVVNKVGGFVGKKKGDKTPNEE